MVEIPEITDISELVEVMRNFSLEDSNSHQSVRALIENRILVEATLELGEGSNPTFCVAIAGIDEECDEVLKSLIVHLGEPTSYLPFKKGSAISAGLTNYSWPALRILRITVH